eukprot:gene13221-biopygen971
MFGDSRRRGARAARRSAPSHRTVPRRGCRRPRSPQPLPPKERWERGGKRRAGAMPGGGGAAPAPPRGGVSLRAVGCDNCRHRIAVTVISPLAGHRYRAVTVILPLPLARVTLSPVL